ncbi:metal-dependent hydrolase [Natronomonas amylolytica]|uniref:metal-dependent hydrolase n=1 Tax=Natronomonas amylolytica TaxID=3108498 RepID=UPI00300ABB52
MYKTGHYGAALLLYAPVGYLLLSVDPGLAVLGGVGAVAFSRVPDYDLKVPGISHRGVTHTLLFLVVATAALAGVSVAGAEQFGTDPLLTGGLGAVVGVVAIGSHLLADALTPSGVPLLWPASSRRFSVSLATASNPIANYGLLALGVGLTVALGYFAGQA